jgi:hypothetical protein
MVNESMDGLLFIIPMLLLSYWVLARFTRLSALQRGVALAVLAIFTEVVSATLWYPGSKVLIRELVWALLIAYLVGILGYIRESRRSGRHSGLRGWGLAFVMMIFALILFLNLGLVYIAEKGLSPELRHRFMPETPSELNFPGLVADGARPQEDILRLYLRGLRRLGERGWKLTETWRSGPTARVGTTLNISIERQDGHPLSGAKIQLEMLSSVSSGRDQWLDLDEGEPGVYQTAMEFGNAGIWGLLLRIEYDHETLHLFSTIDVSSYPLEPVDIVEDSAGSGINARQQPN